MGCVRSELHQGRSIDAALDRALERERELWNSVRGKSPGEPGCPEALWREWVAAKELVHALAAERIRSTIAPDESTSIDPRLAPAPQARFTGVPLPKRPTRLRGFALIDRQRQLEIARMGGKAAHSSGNAYEFTSEEGRAAARKRYRKPTDA